MRIIEAINKYLSVLESDITEDEAIESLMESLDTLASVCHRIEFQSDDNDYPDPPEADHARTMEVARKRFPSLGFYNVAGEISENISECDLHVGDAISDIAEIADDLNEVLWYFENTTNENALFYFELGYRTHWGRHMRELQLYLHDKWW
jgi:hypothetical protein